MAFFERSALNEGVRPREVFAWSMYDFANSGYTTVVLTAVFNAYFVGAVAGGAVWATFAWTAALSLSCLLVILTAPAIGAWADAHGAKPANLTDAEWAMVLSHRTRAPKAPPARKPEARKPAANKAPARKPVAKAAAAKADPNQALALKPGATKKPASKATTPKATSQKAASSKPAAKKPAVKKPAVTKPTAAKPAVKKPAAKKPAVKKPVSTAPSANGAVVAAPL